jgi:hypothetical protein
VRLVWGKVCPGKVRLRGLAPFAPLFCASALSQVGLLARAITFLTRGILLLAPAFAAFCTRRRTHLGAQQRIIRVQEMPVTRCSPQNSLTKLSQAASPPVPVMHSPPRVDGQGPGGLENPPRHPLATGRTSRVTPSFSATSVWPPTDAARVHHNFCCLPNPSTWPRQVCEAIELRNDWCSRRNRSR